MAKKPLGTVIAVGNQKGGVGKTTNTVHVAAALGEKGHRCLIIDLDPGAGATKHLGVKPDSFAGTFELISTDDSPTDLAVIDGMPKGVELIPARTELSEIDKHLSKFLDRTHVLDRGLELAKEDYDFILLDTPPFAGATTTVAAYSTADWFLLSAFPHILSIHGLNEALNDIADARSRRNPKLEIIGLVFSSVDRRTRAKVEVEELIRKHFPDRAFSTYISQAVALNQAAEKGKTLFDIKRLRKHPVADQYRTIAAEVYERVTNRDAFLAGTLRHTAEPAAVVEEAEPVAAAVNE